MAHTGRCLAIVGMVCALSAAGAAPTIVNGTINRTGGNSADPDVADQLLTDAASNRVPYQ